MSRFISMIYPLIIGAALVALAVYIGQHNREVDIPYILICTALLIAPIHIVEARDSWERKLMQIYYDDNAIRATHEVSLRSFCLGQTASYTILSLLVLMITGVISSFWAMLLIFSWGILSGHYVKKYSWRAPRKSRLLRVINRF